ncbi:DNRLRE domain-containing protein [Paenibacillus sp. FSL R5-0517]|uniref:CBM96 family carbohydrate-binding protein n=1 Tax=Paenibacillus sp. FSL R5-0517 TaxID=2921647 RepID=UPI0030DC7B30
MVRVSVPLKKISFIVCAVLLLTGLLPGKAMVSAETDIETESPSGVAPISNLDTSTYQKPTLVANGKPFFFNGVQIRDDKILTRFNYTDAQMQNVYQLAADDGFTVANSQILWSMIQPDQVFSATESTYISGGTNASTNFSTSKSVKAKYDSTNVSNQALTYLKFDFTSLSETSADAAKIRIYVNSMDAGTANLHLYGITDDSWNASTMTWNSGAPNHDGYQVSGTLGVDYFDLGITPSYDPVNQVAMYDFDVTDFVNNHAFGDGKKASFILQTDTVNNVGVTMDGTQGATYSPKLIISRADAWDYSWLDKVIGFAETANLKLELMWFGSDTTKMTNDHRVPYYVIRNFTKMQTNDGQVLLEKAAGYTNEAVYTFRMSKNDPNLRAQEYTALKNMFDHVAEYNATHGNKQTVIGANISNEPGNGIGGTRSYDSYSNADYTAGGYTSHNRFNWDSYWVWAQNLGAAVKQSNYPVWTRINFHTFEGDFIFRNEEMKARGETTYVDFVGYDPYIGSTDEGFRYGLGLWPDTSYLPYNYGGNFPMIMETSGSRSTSDYLNIATLAGGSTYNIYNMMANDGNDLYNNGPNNLPVAKNNNTTGIRKTNLWLKTIWYDLATKKPDSSGGTMLKFFNEHADNAANVTKNIRDINIVYSTANKGVGMAIERSENEIALASKTASTFTLENLLAYGPVTMTTGYYDENNSWVSTGSKSFTTNGNDVTVAMNEYDTVRVVSTSSLPELNTYYSINDDFLNSYAGWTTQGKVSIADKPGVLDQSLHIEGSSSSAESSFAEKTFTPVSGDVKMEFRIRRNEASGTVIAPDVYDNLGNVALSLAMDTAGNIVYKNASGAWATLQTYTNRTWYKVEMDVNTNTDTYDLYINGVKMLEQEPLATPVTNIAKIRYLAEDATSEANIDKVKIYQEGAPTQPSEEPLHFEAETTPFSTSGITINNVSANDASGGQYAQTSTSTNIGDWVQYTVQVPTAGTYNFNVGYKTHKKSRGTVQLTVDGVNQGAQINQLAATEGFTSVDLGEVTLSAGEHTFRFTVTGKNVSNNSYAVTIDYIDLIPASSKNSDPLDVHFHMNNL